VIDSFSYFDGALVFFMFFLILYGILATVGLVAAFIWFTFLIIQAFSDKKEPGRTEGFG
jgi:hypothetical protein